MIKIIFFRVWRWWWRWWWLWLPLTEGKQGAAVIHLFVTLSFLFFSPSFFHRSPPLSWHGCSCNSTFLSLSSPSPPQIRRMHARCHRPTHNSPNRPYPTRGHPFQNHSRQLFSRWTSGPEALEAHQLYQKDYKTRSLTHSLTPTDTYTCNKTQFKKMIKIKYLHFLVNFFYCYVQDFYDLSPDFLNFFQTFSSPFLSLPFSLSQTGSRADPPTWTSFFL